MFDKFKDECGVFGIFGHPEAANMTYLGLYALQHRGQESAGIASSDSQHVRVSRAMGYVADTFNGEALAQLPGSAAIGHVRYSTAGESKLSNAQPILIDCAHGQIAICHNGNLVNAGELRHDLVRRGSIFQSSSDTEVVLHLYARSKAPSVEDAVVESVSPVQGAFSLVMLTSDRLIAVRDPHGFRPLALVVSTMPWSSVPRRAQWISSAPPTCATSSREKCSYQRAGMRSIKPFPPAPLAHCIFEHVYFARPDSYVRQGVNEVRTELGRILAREQAWRRRRGPVPDSGSARRWDTRSNPACRSMRLIRNHYVGRTFIQPRSSIRHFGVKVKLNRSGVFSRAGRHSRRRFDRARHDESEDRQDGESGRGQRGACPHQLSADDFALLLRRGHAAAVRTHRGDAHARRDYDVSRRRYRGLSQSRRIAQRRWQRAQLVLQLLLHRALSGRHPAGPVDTPACVEAR
jgi:amidophosphoribosyltransferase